MRTWKEYINAPLTGGYRGPLRKGEFYRRPDLFLESLLKNCDFIMNRRNKNVDLEHQPVDLDGFEIDPLLALDGNLSPCLSLASVRYIFLDDNYSTFDGVSLVLPNNPKPVVEIGGKYYYLVAGLYKNSSKIRFDWDHTSRERTFTATLSETFQTDMISLGNPLYGISPHGKGNYFFGLSERPVAPFEDKYKSIFSYGGVIALGASYQPDYEETGIDREIRILSPSALKLIEKWREEATANVI